MARKLPPEAYQLAQTYRLGTPLKRRIGLGWIIFHISMITLFLLVGIAFTIAAFTSPDQNPLFVGCAELIFLGGIGIYLLSLFRAWSRYAYECTDGFVEITRSTRKVRHVLRWNEVASTRVVSGRSLPSYYVTDLSHHEFEVPYYAIWRRCRRIVRDQTIKQRGKETN
ncbi:MAG TPA: hypothetical protein VFN35_24895 [Ktedonobacteraceae bacterium]|nr:hypothetical protein [Ktedonobacteraceae bacterium]